MTRDRRSFVTTLAAVGTAGMAGCLSSLPEWDAADGTADADPTGDDADELDLPGEPVEQFADLDGWVSMLDAGSIEAATDDPYVGSQSAGLRADEDTESAATYKTGLDLDLSDGALSMAVRFTEREQLHLVFEVYAPNSRNAYEFERTLTGPTERWVRVDFGTADVDGDPDLESVEEFRISAHRRGDASGPIDCRIDDVRVVDRPSRGRVMFLFDGTLESHYTTALEHMESYDFAGTEAVIGDAVGEGGRLDLSQLDALDDAGWDMVSRPNTGAQYLHEIPRDRQEGLIRDNKAFLENYGFEDGAAYFVTPRNVLGAESMDLVREYHEGAFRYGGGPNALPLTDPHNVGVFSGTDGDTTQELVDNAAASGQLAVLHFDEIGPDGYPESAFEDLLAYVDARDVDVVTATELSEGD